jgi:hypothetical protein
MATKKVHTKLRFAGMEDYQFVLQVARLTGFSDVQEYANYCVRAQT